jgi:hypothetical protein
VRNRYDFAMSCRGIVTLIVLLVSSLVGSSAAKPRLRVAADGFPTGQATPEGAASDLARAFMARDAIGFRNISSRPYGGGQARAEYTQYLNGVSDHFKQKGNPSPDDPKKIATVFAARHLSRNGPSSYGYTNFEFPDVMFVDVEVVLQSGNRHLRRTMVIKDRDGKWYAQPVPDVSPLLSDGLYDENASVQQFTDAYDVER